jgi:hypothetical protein
MQRIATFALPFALTITTACTTPQQVMDQATNDMVLQSYSVPEGYAGIMASALSRSMAIGDEKVGRVIETPDGQIIVVAPESVQAGVSKLIDQLNDSKPPLRTPTNIRMDYWLVHGTRAEAASTTYPAPVLAETLDAVQQAEGPMDFALYAHKVLTSLDEERARISSDGLFIEQEASWSAAGGAITAEVAIDAAGGTGMRTDIRLQPGQVVVLGEVADIAGDQPFDTLYYIISPSVVVAQ